MSTTTPFTFDIDVGASRMGRFETHVERRLSQMRGQYSQPEAYEALLAVGDVLLYEVYETTRPPSPGEIMNGRSVLHPGKVGDDYLMTKGHFHEVLDTAELYYCLKGRGMMVMENPEGEWAVEEVRPGRALYALPRWAHRSVNTSPDEDACDTLCLPGPCRPRLRHY